MKGRLVNKEKQDKTILPQIGKVKVGFKNEAGQPRSVDYFVPTGKYAARFTEAYGEKPQKLHVVFLEDDPEAVCNLRYVYRDKNGKLTAEGDGEEFKVWNDKKKAYETFFESETPNIMSRIGKKYESLKGWEVVLTLRFILPKISSIVGYWTFETKGEASSIPNITGMFDTIKKHRGEVKGLLFDLTVEFAKSQKPKDKSRFPVVNLVLNQSEDNVNEVKQALIGAPDINLLNS